MNTTYNCTYCNEPINGNLYQEEIKSPPEPLSLTEKIIAFVVLIFSSLFLVMEWGGPFTTATIATNIVPPVMIAASVVGTFFYCYYMVTRTEEPRKQEQEKKKRENSFTEKVYKKLWDKSDLEEKLSLQEMARSHKMRELLISVPEKNL